MAKIGVNNKDLVLGKISVRRFIDEDDKLIIQGSFATHNYFEEIKSLETYRFSITDVEVLEEVFGSDDYDIIYNFSAKKLDIKNQGVVYDENEHEQIEKNLYDDNGYLIKSNLSALSMNGIISEED